MTRILPGLYQNLPELDQDLIRTLPPYQDLALTRALPGLDQEPTGTLSGFCKDLERTLPCPYQDFASRLINYHTQTLLSGLGQDIEEIVVSTVRISSIYF